MAATDEVEILEEFGHHVQRGSDRLALGDAEGALAALERARALRPRDASVLGLLGQALYRAGRFEEAAEAYQGVVDASPGEAAPRVNLGLAHLKARRHDDAIRELERALELQPDHRRASGLLGLAWLERGDAGRAREWFVRAGSEAMIARCDEALAAAAAPADAPPFAASASPAPGGAIPPVPRLRMDPEPRFAIDGALLVTRLGADVLVRAEGLVAVRGAVRLVTAARQQRGLATDRTFGEGARRMVRATGAGALVHALGGRKVARLELDGEGPACVRDDALFAFDATLAYENGRIASGLGKDLDVVQLRGRGAALVAGARDVVAIPISAREPLRVPVSGVVGWCGAVVPHFGVFLAGAAGSPSPDAEPLAVELSGDGVVLVEGDGP